jgi:hypothetical protein
VKPEETAMSSLIDLPPERPMNTNRAEARQATIEQYATPAATSTRRRIGRFAVIAATAASTLLIGGVATAYVAFRPATTPVEDGTRCYSVASLEGGDTDFLGTTVATATNADGTRSASRAVEMCAAVWRAGILKEGVKVKPGTEVASTTVPALEACVLENGMAAVFPGAPGTCRNLGLPGLAE